MRTYEIKDADGTVVSTQTMDDNFGPVLMVGHAATLTHINGVAVPSSMDVVRDGGPMPPAPVMAEADLPVLDHVADPVVVSVQPSEMQPMALSAPAVAEMASGTDPALAEPTPAEPTASEAAPSAAASAS